MPIEAEWQQVGTGQFLTARIDNVAETLPLPLFYCHLVEDQILPQNDHKWQMLGELCSITYFLSKSNFIKRKN
jgi:hypothetical protein